MKVCIIGSTGHINYVFNGLQQTPQARLVGAAKGSPGETTDRLLAQASRFDIRPQIFDDYRDMLDRLRPDIVAIACHFGDHAKIAVEALQRGIHVFVEKPVATTLQDLAKVREAYAKSGVHLAAMFGIRYTAHFLTAWHAVREGSIGQIRLLHAQKSYKLGKRAPLYHRRETYGGTIPWVGSHAIDWLHWFSGETFESVYASHSTLGNQDHGELEATGLCHFTMSNEVFASASIDYLRPAAAPSHDDDRLRIAGTEGVIEVRNGCVYLINGKQNGVQELPLMPAEQIFADFVRQVEQGVPCRVSAEDSFIVTEACLKARQSADERRPVFF
jgi:predicted dehydrogenase